MPFNPKTFNLSSRYQLGELLSTTLNKFDTGELDPDVGARIRAQSKAQANALKIELHRYRSAFRAQAVNKELSDKYDGLVIGVKEQDGQYWITIKQRSMPDLHVQDGRDGTEVFRVTK